MEYDIGNTRNIPIMDDDLNDLASNVTPIEIFQIDIEMDRLG